MKDKTDVPVEVISETGKPLGGFRYKHPSYGKIQLYRTSGGDRELFGSNISHNNTMRLTISKADVRQDLGRNWYYSSKEIVEVEMGETQYATLISSPNTEGVPCTIRYTQTDGHIKFRPHTKQIEYTEQKIKAVAEDMSKVVDDNLDRVKEMLTKKSALNKEEKKELINLFTSVKNCVNNSVPFYRDQLKKGIEDMKTEAKAELDAHVTSVMTKLGEKVAGNTEFVKMLLEDKGE